MKPWAKLFINTSGTSINFINQKDKNLDLRGGIFGKSNKYTLKFYNDFSNIIYQLDAQVIDLNYLKTKT